MPYFISKPTSRELRERLAESASKVRPELQGKVRGVTRNTEEADHISRRLEREGEPITSVPLAVSGEAPESKQARVEIAQRVPQFAKDPEAYERYMA